MRKTLKVLLRRWFIISIDINECEHYNNTCNINASCMNSEGSFSCLCLPGYTGDGFEECSGRCRKCHHEVSIW